MVYKRIHLNQVLAQVECICEECGKTHISNCARKRTCDECCPTKFYRTTYAAYGIAKKQYDSLLAANNGKCWICLKRKSKAIDHCHTTGKIRGLLCRYCNSALSILEDRDTRERAMKYLSSDEYSFQGKGYRVE